MDKVDFEGKIKKLINDYTSEESDSFKVKEQYLNYLLNGQDSTIYILPRPKDKPIKIIIDSTEYSWKIQYENDNEFEIKFKRKLTPKEKEQLLENLFNGAEAYGIYGSEN